jgi:hypothetical protein
VRDQVLRIFPTPAADAVPGLRTVAHSKTSWQPLAKSRSYQSSLPPSQGWDTGSSQLLNCSPSPGARGGLGGAQLVALRVALLVHRPRLDPHGENCAV